MRIIIAGGRDFNDYGRLEKECLNIIKQYKEQGVKTDKAHIEIVSGLAKGADTLGLHFAEKYHLKTARFPANWNLYGKRAGIIRNEQMAAYASQDTEIGLLIAFWDSRSHGTKHMIHYARQLSLATHVIGYGYPNVKGAQAVGQMEKERKQDDDDDI